MLIYIFFMLYLNFRVLSAILLLGNVRFTPSVGDDFEVEVIGKEELHSTAKLLGVSPTMLIQGLTTRTHSVRGQPINSLTDSHQVHYNDFQLSY